MDNNRFLPLFACAVIVGGMLFSGCNGSMAPRQSLGKGLGAIAAGTMQDDKNTVLLGPGVGQGGGYIINDAQDKKIAQAYDYNTPTLLTGTKWNMLVLITEQGEIDEPMTFEFRPDGKVITRYYEQEKRIALVEEKYRIVGETIIIFGSDYIVNAQFDYYTTELVIDSKEFRVVMRRIETP